MSLKDNPDERIEEAVEILINHKWVSRILGVGKSVKLWKACAFVLMFISCLNNIYTIIGGTACDLLMSDEGLDFRATNSILICAEASIRISVPVVLSFFPFTA